MKSFSKYRKSVLGFTLYFLFVAAFPFSHCHAEDVISLSHSGKPDCNVKHLLFPKSDAHCCSINENSPSEEGHHIHFTISDANAPIRPNTISADQVPLQVVAITENSSIQPLKPSFSASVHAHHEQPHEGFSRSFSGLSPPVV